MNSHIKYFIELRDHMAKIEISAEEKMALLSFDAVKIAHIIQTRKYTIEEITHTYIQHIKTVNPSLNGIVEERFNEALLEAQKKDRLLSSINPDEKPLYGVPITIKEAFQVAHMSLTGGLIGRKDIIANKDAIVVHKLRNAGAIILGTTNTPELCFCQETENKLYGRTNNAWDLTKSAGGSSGGEGAILGVGGSVVGIGSDIGGSIRFPSHFNGVCGFKSGQYQIPSEGHFPDTPNSIQARMFGIGPMGKSVRDLELVYSIIAEHVPTSQSYQTMTIDILPNNTYPLSATTGKLLDKIEDSLKDTLAVKRVTPPFFNESAQLWQEIMSIDGGAYIRTLALPSQKNNLITTYLKEKLTKNTTTHSYLSWALIGAKLFQPSPKRVEEIKNTLQHGDEKLTDYLMNRLLIFPVYHSSAPKHGMVYKEIFSIRKTFRKYMPYTAYANVWGLPALTVPVGRDPHNMPIGIQIIGLNGNEAAIFSLGKVLENIFGGYDRSTMLDKPLHN